MIQLYPTPEHKDAVYTAMLDRIDCGPFDGGCVSFAMALQRIFGGEVQVITGNLLWNPRDTQWSKGAQHAVLRLPDGRLLDGDGPGSPEEVVSRFLRVEITPPAFMEFTGLRELREDDLPDAPRDEALIEQLVRLLAHPQAEAAREKPIAPWLDERVAPNGRAVRDNFREWFSQSKVLDRTGHPLVVYHGTRTREDFSSFAPDSHFGTIEAADAKACNGGVWGPGRIIPVYLLIENPKRVRDVATIGWGEWDEVVAQAKAEGHDGIVYLNEAEGAGSDSWIAFRPEQIKSAIGNSGDFDPTTNACMVDAVLAPTPKRSPAGPTP